MMSNNEDVVYNPVTGKFMNLVSGLRYCVFCMALKRTTFLMRGGECEDSFLYLGLHNNPWKPQKMKCKESEIFLKRWFLGNTYFAREIDGHLGFRGHNMIIR